MLMTAKKTYYFIPQFYFDASLSTSGTSSLS